MAPKIDANQLIQEGSAILDCFATLLDEGLGSLDERWMSYALAKTDPDPVVQNPQPASIEERIKTFKSVVDLVRKKPSPVEKYPFLYLGAEGYEAYVRSLSIEDLLSKLKGFEVKAFRYDPKTRESNIADFTAYLDLKNLLRAVERAAFENAQYLKKVDRKEIYRLAILLAEELTAKDRGSIYQMEKEGLSLYASIERSNLDFLNYLKNYDGKTDFFDSKEFKGFLKLAEYDQLHWPEEELINNAQKFAKEKQSVIRETLARHVSQEVFSQIARLTDEQLISELVSTQAQAVQAKLPEEKVTKVFLWEALAWEWTARGRGNKEAIKAIANIIWKNQLLGDSVFKFHTRQTRKKMENPLLVGMDAYNTTSRLDNYQARREFLAGAKTAIKEGLKLQRRIVSMLKEAPTLRGEDFSSFIEYVPVINLLLSVYMLVASDWKIPLDGMELLDLVDEKFLGKEVSLLGGKIVNQPMTWEEVKKRGTVRLSLNAYLATDPLYENEWEVFKNIFYQGSSLYDLGQSVVHSVTLSPAVSHDDESGTGLVLGTSRSLFRNIMMAYVDEQGERLPADKRLEVAAHELFHNIENLRFLSGVAGGRELPALRERNAYFFGAYVLEEYLKLRWQNRMKNPLSEKELKSILWSILEARSNGFTANWMIKQVYDPFDLEDRRIEIPLSMEVSIWAALDEAVKDPNMKDKIEEYTAVSPVDKVKTFLSTKQKLKKFVDQEMGQIAGGIFRDRILTD